MGFARAYLQKAALRQARIRHAPHPGLELIITLPVHRESGLERCLDSLFVSLVGAVEDQGASGPVQTEVLILFNASEDASDSTYGENLEALRQAEGWLKAHQHPNWNIHFLVDHAMPARHAGVGLARKLLMDEALSRFDVLNRPRGIIASLDADVVVDPSYIPSLKMHFQESGMDGASIYFEHPLSARTDPFAGQERGNPFDEGEAYEAIIRYELHLRYYLHSVRSTGYPHAHHTVGSAFAVRALAYSQEGGMNKRQGGEDFYFIQKLSQRGHWSDCTTTRVVPSPRPSDRVPFGTGPAVARLLEESRSTQDPVFSTYHPELFKILKGFFHVQEGLEDASSAEAVLLDQDELLQQFLQKQDFFAALKEMRANSASTEAFRKRFWRWFNPFRIMKFLHFARDKGYPDIGVEKAAGLFLGSEASSALDLLLKFRELDRA